MYTRRYRRSDDVYSLGVILVEIALWDPATDYCDSNFTRHILGQHDAVSFSKRAFEAANEKLTTEVGELYQSAVIARLRALRTQGITSVYDGTYRGEDSEYGWESDLLWKVVRQLEKLRV